MCPDSEIAKGVKMSHTKVSYVIGHGLGSYFLQKTVDDILNTPRTYFTLHFDETTTSQIKKQLDILVRYYSDNHNEVRVRFLKAAVFGHAYAESVANELCEMLQKFSLPLKYLLSLSSDGPNVNKAIKTIINSKLKANYQRELVDTGPCQLHVVHNSFRKGVEGYGSDVENLCINMYYLKLSPPRREDSADVQQKLNPDEFVFLRHVQSQWLSLIPAIERVRKQFPALKENFRKLPDSDKNIAKNARYKRIMTLLTSPEAMVQLCFLESVKSIFDKFLESFQVEGTLIHNLYPCMILLLKQMMSQFLKPKVIQKKTVAELLKLNMKHSDSQLKDSELEIGLPTRQALNDVKKQWDAEAMLSWY